MTATNILISIAGDCDWLTNNYCWQMPLINGQLLLVSANNKLTTIAGDCHFKKKIPVAGDFH